MEQFFQNIIPLSEGKSINKPYNKNDNYKEKWKKLERELNKRKNLNEYESIAMCLYWIGKEMADKRFTRLLPAYRARIARKVYAFAKGNKRNLLYCTKVPLKCWEKVKLTDTKELGRIMKRILDGARINVGEDVNPDLYPNNPQQSSTTAENQMIGLSEGNQNEGSDNWSETYNLVEEFRKMSNPQEDEDSWPMWDDLIGRLENTSEDA
jgi:hypothetical protein